MTLDISKTLVADSSQLNAVDLIGGPATVQITHVSEYKDAKQPIAVTISGGYKPWIICKAMRRLLAEVWGADAGKWVGKWVTLYREPTVTYGNDPQGGVRVSGLSDIPKSFTATIPDSVTVVDEKNIPKKKKLATYRVEKITPPAPAVMDLKTFQGWMSDALKRSENPWTEAQLKLLLGCPSAEVAPERRAELVAIMKKAPVQDDAGGAE